MYLARVNKGKRNMSTIMSLTVRMQHAIKQFCRAIVNSQLTLGDTILLHDVSIIGS